MSRKQTIALEYVEFDNSAMTSQRMIKFTSVGHQGLPEGGDTWAKSEEWLILQENVEGWDGQGEIPKMDRGKEEWRHVT